MNTARATKYVPKILIVEDDQVLNQQIADVLESRGYEVYQVLDGDEGLTMAVSHHYDLILLDIMLPSRDGLSFLNILRNSDQTPVIIVSAKHAEEERIKGLSAGADDYLAKPFNTEELILRADAILRRSRSFEDNGIHVQTVDGLTVDRRQHRVSVNGTLIELTQTQLNLLWTLLQNQGEILTKAFLYQAVLHRRYSSYDRSLDMHLSRVRRKLSEAGWNGSRLVTVHGKGYCFR